MKTKSWNAVALVGVVLGASLGAVVALLLVRRWRRSNELGPAEIPWRELITLVGPVIALARRLVEIGRRELVELDKR